MSADSSKIIVRFPPSPTGEIHIGNVRTLLFNYLFAKKNNGKIVFRFEDTDKERSQVAYEQPMLDALHNLGLSWDEGPYRQSERGEVYKKYLKQLVDEGKAYEAEENAAKTGKIVRLKNNEREIVWDDLIKGEIKINTHTFKDESGNPDIVIARSLEDAIYHFTVVVDDWLMGVTHVIRGDDHVTSTPRQIMIFEALGAEIPRFGHLPTIIGEDRKKLSKRNGTTSLATFFELGYTKETMVNYLALLGWNPGDEREFFSLEELIKEFSLERCQKSPAQFDFKKLDHINKHYLDQVSEVEYLSYIQKNLERDLRFENSLADLSYLADKEFLNKIIIKIARDRISKSSDFINELSSGEFDYLFTEKYQTLFAEFDKAKIQFKNQTAEEARANIQEVINRISALDEKDFVEENLKNLLWDWAGEVGRGQVLHPLRTLLSLKDKSPDPFTIMTVLGKEESLRRLNNFLV
jgi:glutamyl-tRNA synthetase